MASVSGGYNNNFVETPPDDYLCLICHSVCRDPQQATCCAKLYCEACLEECTKFNNRCPTCRRSIVVFEDKLSHRRIKALKVRCDNEEAGCHWIGELGSIEEHLAKCEFIEIQCTNGCSKEVLRRDLDKHLASSCPKRKYGCPHCSLEGEHCEITTTHLDKCPNIVIMCQSSDCDFQTKRSEMENHLAVCPKQKVDCPFAEIGCKESMVRLQLDKHKSENVQAHLELAVKAIATLRAFKPVVFKIPNFQQFKEEGSTWYSPEFYTHARGYRMKLSVDVEEEEEKAEDSEEGQEEEEEEEVASNLSKDEDGEDKGKETGSHLAVYAYISSGEHDNSLVWPFRGSITIQLFNQLEDKAHHSMVLDFPDSSIYHVCVKKPDRGQSNEGWGNPIFISCDSLGYDKECNSQYLMDDCLYLRVYNVTVECITKPWLTPTN